MNQRQITSVLRDHCEKNTPAMLLSVDSGRLCHASFQGASKEAVTLEVFDFARGIPFHPMDIGVVSFHDGERGCLFMSTVLDVRQVDETELPRLVLARPLELFQAERRTMFRLSLTESTELAVAVKSKKGEEWSPRPVDISLGGVQLEFSNQDEAPGMRVDQRLRVELLLRGRTVKLAGSVRWRRGRRCGLSFPEVVRGARVNPPKAFRSMMEQLEGEWLRQRILTEPAA